MAAPPNPPWLVMLYMAGDNNLTEEMVLAMQELMLEGPPADDKIVAQFDPSGMGLSTQRYDFSNPSGPPLAKYRRPFGTGSVNMGSKDVLIEFIKWARDQLKDENGIAYGVERNHMLILCGHGSGITEDFLMTDESAMDSLTINELKEALENVGYKGNSRLNILGFDACYMCMGEVAYELRNSVDIMIGAEGLEPEFGWPYRRILARAKAHRAGPPAQPPMDPPLLASAIVEEYIGHYADYDRTAGRSVDLAAVDLQKLAPVKDAFKQLVQELTTKDPYQLALVHWKTQTYKCDQFVDLWDLCKQLKDHFGGALVTKCDSVRVACEACIIKCGCSGYAYQHSCGLSIYFPWAVLSADYRNLTFGEAPPEETSWCAFLESHLDGTRRSARAGYSAPVYLSTARLQQLLREARGGPVVASGPDEKAIVHEMEQLDALPTSGKGNSLGGRRLDDAVTRLVATPVEDIPSVLIRRVSRAGALHDAGGRYTGIGSRYTGIGSRYTGVGSRYTGVGSRSPFDRERSVKNLTPVIGKTFAPPFPPF